MEFERESKIVTRIHVLLRYLLESERFIQSARFFQHRQSIENQAFSALFDGRIDEFPQKLLAEAVPTRFAQQVHLAHFAIAAIRERQQSSATYDTLIFTDDHFEDPAASMIAVGKVFQVGVSIEEVERKTVLAENGRHNIANGITVGTGGFAYRPFFARAHRLHGS